MNITHSTPAGVGISLSRRNLEHLLRALDSASEVRPYLIREVTDSEGKTRTLTVYVEENEAHYENRKAGPGFEWLSPTSEDIDDPRPWEMDRD